MNNPHLAYALLQAQVLLGIISQSDAQQLHIAAQQQVIPTNNVPIAVNPNFVPPNYNNFQNPNLQPQFGQPMNNNNINQPFNQGQPDALASLPEDQKELLERVLQLTPDQIERLQPHEQQQIMQLKLLIPSNFRRG